MNKMYGRLRSTRKRALAHRQCEILNILLDRDVAIEYRDLFALLEKHYKELREPLRAFVRDLNGLSSLNATSVRKEGQKGGENFMVVVRPEWATKITETEFFKEINKLPAAKTGLVVTR